MSNDKSIQFFWEKNPKQKASKSRFNLLLLEYGEYYFEDFSAYIYPVPTITTDVDAQNNIESIVTTNNASNKSFIQCDNMKVQGRLKLCTNSLIFEPNDVRKPLLKFLFKHIKDDIDIYNISNDDLNSCSIYTSGFLTFSISIYYEMKENNRVSPYKMVAASTSSNTTSSPSSFSNILKFNTTTTSTTDAFNTSSSIHNTSLHNTSNTCQVLLAIVHSDLSYVNNRLREMLSIYRQSIHTYTNTATTSNTSNLMKSATSLNSESSNNNTSNLQSLINKASYHNFDTSQLINYNEKLLLTTPIIVKNVKPLLLYPGCIMITNIRIYFQPAQLNYVGVADSTGQNYDRVLNIENIVCIYKRRYLQQQIGIELFMTNNTSSLYICENKRFRDLLYTIIKRTHTSYTTNTHSSTHTLTTATTSHTTTTTNNNNNTYTQTLTNVIHQWQTRQISNFDYLMYLNREADRSMNDLTQYPVFPHILCDYTSKVLNLSDPNVYRYV